MFHVLSCKKFHPRTLRIVNLGSSTFEDVQKMDMGECQLCGPCSHVELGTCRGWWEHHSGPHTTADDAAVAAWTFYEESAGNYSKVDLPPRSNREIEVAAN